MTTMTFYITKKNKELLQEIAKDFYCSSSSIVKKAIQDSNFEEITYSEFPISNENIVKMTLSVDQNFYNKIENEANKKFISKYIVISTIVENYIKNKS